MKEVTIRRFADGEEAAVSELIRETLLVSNSADYPEPFLREIIENHNAQTIARQAQEAHMYVVCAGGRIIGCGGITGYWGSTTESYLLSIFVHPDYQGQGIGRRIVMTLEEDDYFRRAWRTEIGSSITAVNFYRHLGYVYKNGVTEPDQYGVIRLEKRREDGNGEA